MDIKKLTDFDDISDVSDAALVWVMKSRDPQSNGNTKIVRREKHYMWTKGIIMTARLIQAHHPELLIDPDLKIAREIAAQMYDNAKWESSAASILAGEGDHCTCVQAALAAYKKGKADGR